MSHYQHLLEQLKQLRLGGLVDSLELRLKEAEKQQLSYLDFLSLLIQDELQRRSQSKFARRLKKACFADLKTLEEFDFKFNPAIERRRHPGNSNVRFDGFDAQDILGALQPRLAASTGAACASGIPEPSHVLGALGLTEMQSKASIRFSFGRFTTDEDIEAAARFVLEALNSLSVESVKMPV